MKGLLKILCYIFYFPCLRNNKNQDHSNSHELQIITKEKKNSNTESKIINEINNEYDNNYNIINNKIYNFWYKSKSVDENIINSSYEINTENNKILVESLSSISSNDNNNDDDLNIVPNNSPCNSPKILNIPTNYSVSSISLNTNINISPNFSYLINKY